MQQLAEDIVTIIGDYHCDYTDSHAFVFTTEHIINWANQFGEADREFVLEELLHLLHQGIYVSKSRAKELLLLQVQSLTQKYSYPDPASYLKETVFLRMQGEHKSQIALLNLLDEILQEHYHMSLGECGTLIQRNFIYLDDVLATGKTILRDCRTWLAATDVHAEGNLKAFVEGKVRFAIVVFCSHTWAVENIKTSLKLHFNEDKVVKRLEVYRNYSIENQVLSASPKLNLTYPVNQSIPEINTYLHSLEATKYENRAYRKVSQPANEEFFSSPTNRIRFENLLLLKGIEILNSVINLRDNQRPLGNTYPNYKTFGTGTLFFTWRNISNTCPIVFWWDNPAHNWHGLFPLFNRGR